MSSSLRQDPSILQVLFFASRKFSELRQFLLSLYLVIYDS
jgi:hypothetical protein